MIFKSAIDKVTKITFGFIILLLLVIAITSIDIQQKISMFIAISLVSLTLFLLVWMYLKTEYQIKEDILFCSCGPIKKQVKIKEIMKITYHSGIIVPVSLKLSLSSSGFIITYGNFNEFYISPENQEEFITQLRTINPNFVITRPNND